MSKKQIESMIMKADLNGDGSVSFYLCICQLVPFFRYVDYEEFVKMMQA